MKTRCPRRNDLLSDLLQELGASETVVFSHGCAAQHGMLGAPKEVGVTRA
jgi:hypothetical protein